MTDDIIKHFKATGKVQDIMFRQTLMRGVLKRGLEAGASNCHKDRNTAYFCLKGREDKIRVFIEEIGSGKILNSWGCKIDKIEEISQEKDFHSYQVTTDNVDNFNWNPDITLYL